METWQAYPALDTGSMTMKPMLSFRSLLPSLLLLTLALPVQAETRYCVGTPAQFQEALDQAAIDAGDSLIQVRSGTYHLTRDLRYAPITEFIIPVGRLTVRGGYNADCSSDSPAPDATTIHGSGEHVFSAETVTDSVTLAGLTFENAFVRVQRPLLAECVGTAHRFAFQQIRIDRGSLDITSLCHEVLIENTMLTNGIRIPGSLHAQDTSLHVHLVGGDTYAPPSLAMSNSSVINGRTTFTRCCDSAATARVFTSVFDRAAGPDIFSDVDILALNNRYDGIVFSSADGDGLPAGVLMEGSADNLDANPQRDAQPVPVTGSPMIGSGTANVRGGVPATDPAGNQRRIGFTGDRGALASGVNGSETYVVTNTDAAGTGSLAWAVDLANNNPGFNIINFNIPGESCPYRINLAGPLQIRNPMLIDGWSQPGNVKNTDPVGFNAVPCVVLNGGGTVSNGIETMAEMSAGALGVHGLGFEGFGVAIALTYGQFHGIEGNQFGGQVGDGFTLSGNVQAIALIGSDVGRSSIGGSGIGGVEIEQRNLIGDSSDVGVLITPFMGVGGRDNFVLINLIGLDKNGIDPLPNGTGVRINGPDNRVLGNRIGGNTLDGIVVSGPGAEGNEIRENRIGANMQSCPSPGAGAGNGGVGVVIEDAAYANFIGPANWIDCNGQEGVRVMPSAGGRNRIYENRINSNGGLGIDLGNPGVTANDTDPTGCDPVLGCASNRGQNFPLLSTAVRAAEGSGYPVNQPIRITGTLRSSIGGPYRIEFFGSSTCDSTGHGEGDRLLGLINVTITDEPYCPIPGGACEACVDSNCTTGFSAYVTELDVGIGDFITATAGPFQGGRSDTSEFSACLALVGDTIFADGFEE
jgi:hypothetical protein